MQSNLIPLTILFYIPLTTTLSSSIYMHKYHLLFMLNYLNTLKPITRMPGTLQNTFPVVTNIIFHRTFLLRSTNEVHWNAGTNVLAFLDIKLNIINRPNSYCTIKLHWMSFNFYCWRQSMKARQNAPQITPDSDLSAADQISANLWKLSKIISLFKPRLLLGLTIAFDKIWHNDLIFKMDRLHLNH